MTTNNLKQSSFVCCILLILCQCSTPSKNQNKGYETNCSSQKLEELGVDIQSDKDYDENLGSLVFKNIHLTPFKFKDNQHLYTLKFSTLEVEKDKKVSYLIVPHNRTKLKGDCFAEDIERLGEGWEEKKKKALASNLMMFLEDVIR